MSKLTIPSKSVPTQIRNWVKETLDGKDLREYSLHQNEEVEASMPWHEGDRQYYKMFKLLPNNEAEETSFEFERSGLEGDGSITGKEIKGKTKVPSGHVIVVVGIFPRRAEIYTAEDSQILLPQKNSDLSDLEILALYYTRSLIPSARPKFKDKTIYDKLIEKGLLKKNKAITIEGKNALEAPDMKEKIDELRFSDEMKAQIEEGRQY